MKIMTLGAKIRYLRRMKGFTLEGLADAIGSGKSYIWEVENRGIKNPSARMLAEIANVLDVTTQYLLSDDPEYNPRGVPVVDKKFFDKYRLLKEREKKQIRAIVNMWVKNEQTRSRS